MLIDRLPSALLRIPAVDRWWIATWFRSPPPESAHNGVGNYFAVGREFVAHFAHYCGLTPGAHVLDVGCGSGRIALGLARHLNDRSRYAGFDVRPEAVNWCTAHISRRYPHFEFTLVDVLNHACSPQARRDA